MSTDGDVALTILRQVFAERMGCVILEDGMFLLDTSWVDATPEQMALLERLRNEPGSQYA